MGKYNFELQKVRVEDIQPNPNNPRGLSVRDNDDQFQYLKRSIKEFGLIVPIVVKKVPKANNKYVLLDGERRYYAVKELGIKEIIAKILKDFSKDYLAAKRSPEADLGRVKSLIDSLLSCDPRFKLGSKPIHFMKSIEGMLLHSKRPLRDHYFHACNTMIIGFVILDMFYDQFCTACRIYGDDIVPEFIWAITSLYHDIGYPASLHTQMLVDTYDAEDDRILLDASARQVRQNLWDKRYIRVGNVLEHLYSHTTGQDGSPWEYDGFCHETTSPEFLRGLEASFVEAGSHGAQGVLILMSLIDKEIRKLRKQSDRKYLYRHIALGAVSILFHDAAVRNVYRKNGINRIRIADFPIGGLLAYVDTLQDDRRDLSGVLTRPDIFKDVVKDGTSILARLNMRVIDTSRRSKLYSELREVFDFFISNGLRFVIPLELQTA